MNIKKLEKKIDLKWLKKQTILNIISARGIIFTYYKNKQQQERESYEQKKTIQTR
tara:strand:+ start:188 stop:352 length:165 start_codon:yes stop_codon:yes gene_type:complete